MLDGAMARQSGGGTRFGAVLDATCDRIGDGAIFCGLLWWAAFGMRSTSLVVALMICLVTSQVISYVKARAEASGLSGEGGLIERPERLVMIADRRGAVGRVVPARSVAAARRGLAAGGGQPDHPRPARAHRAYLARRDGTAAEDRAGGGSVTTTPTGPQAAGGDRFSIGGQVS